MATWRPHLLKVFFSNRYTYASIVRKQSPTDVAKSIAAASTVSRDVKELLRSNGASHCDVRASVMVGKLLAEQAKAAQVDEVHFDNHKGLKYEGKVRALIESIRSNGVKVK